MRILDANSVMDTPASVPDTLMCGTAFVWLLHTFVWLLLFEKQRACPEVACVWRGFRLHVLGYLAQKKQRHPRALQ